MKAFPPVTPNLLEWAKSLTRSLAFGWSQLEYKDSDSRATQDGLILWSDTDAAPVVSRSSAFVPLARRVAAPATAAGAGTLGDWASDTGYFYVCTATNTWKRVAIATW